MTLDSAFSGNAAIYAAAAVLAGTNLHIFVGFADQLCCLPADVYAGCLFILAGLCLMVILDPQVLVALFCPVLLSSEKKEKNELHPLSTIWKSDIQAFPIRGFTVLNWMAGLAIIISAMQISLNTRINNYSQVVCPTTQIMLDLLTGDLELNALLRTGAEDLWQSKYGLACGLYMYAVFSIVVIRRALAARRFAVAKIVSFVATGLLEAACGQFFTSRNIAKTSVLLVANVFWLLYCINGNPVPPAYRHHAAQVFSMKTLALPTFLAVGAAIFSDASATAWFLRNGSVIVMTLAVLAFSWVIRYDADQQPVTGWIRLPCEIVAYITYLPIVAAFWSYGAVGLLLAVVRSVLRLDHRPPLDPTKSGKLEMDHFDLDSGLDFAMLRREYVDKSIPFVLYRSSGKPLSEAALPEDVRAKSQQDSIRITYLPFFGKIPGLDDLVTKLLPPFTPRAYHPLWFSGAYKQGTAHIDLGPATVNFYFMKSGMKDVIIVPTEVSRGVTGLARGMDGIHWDGSANPERAYLKTLPYYYNVVLKPQTMLVFNNSGSIHHFCNIYASDGSPPEALSLRMLYSMNCDPRILYNFFTNPRLYWRAASFVSHLAFVEAGETRKQDYK
jgi:hypothetical protein